MYGHTTFCLSIYQLLNISTIHIFQPLWIMLWISTCKFLHLCGYMFTFIFGSSLQVKLLEHAGFLFQRRNSKYNAIETASEWSDSLVLHHSYYIIMWPEHVLNIWIFICVLIKHGMLMLFCVFNGCPNSHICIFKNARATTS